jgi:hypothetical protein
MLLCCAWFPGSLVSFKKCCSTGVRVKEFSRCLRKADWRREEKEWRSGASRRAWMRGSRARAGTLDLGSWFRGLGMWSGTWVCGVEGIAGMDLVVCPQVPVWSTDSEPRSKEGSVGELG